MNNGIQPTVELATNNGNGFAYPYPVMPMMGGFGGNGFGNAFGGDGAWLLILIILLFANGGWNNNGGGFFGGNSFDNGYAWLSNGQKEIMQNTNNGFDTLHLSNQIEGVRDGIYGISNSICSSTGNIIQALNSGFSSAEISANTRQIADMNQNFSNQIATLQGFNGLQKSLDTCCCENRLGIANLGADIAREACATRTSDTQNTQTLLTAINGGIQSIKDQICQDKIDEKNDTIAMLRQELLYSRGQASQVQQTADIRASQAVTANQLVSELRSCPIPAMPVYGNQAIFTCPNNNGCGCAGNNGYYFN